jgi:hypothetical protein
MHLSFGKGEYLTDLDKNHALIQLAESTRTDFGKVDFGIQSAPQKVFSSIWELESRVNSGGFDAYLRDTDSEVIAHASVALREIGALHCCAIVERALKVLGSLPSTRHGRDDALDALAADDAFEVLDQEFFAYPDDLTELLFAFVARHSETFGRIF